MSRKPGGRRYLFCPQCGAGFTTPAALEAHIRSDHP